MHVEGYQELSKHQEGTKRAEVGCHLRRGRSKLCKCNIKVLVYHNALFNIIVQKLLTVFRQVLLLRHCQSPHWVARLKLVIAGQLPAKGAVVGKHLEGLVAHHSDRDSLAAVHLLVHQVSRETPAGILAYQEWEAFHWLVQALEAVH